MGLDRCILHLNLTRHSDVLLFFFGSRNKFHILIKKRLYGAARLADC